MPFKLIENRFNGVFDPRGEIEIGSAFFVPDRNGGVAPVGSTLGIRKVGGIGAPPCAVIEGRHGRSDAAEKGGREIGDIEMDGNKLGEEAAADVGEGGTEPDDMDDIGIQCPAVFACICAVVSGSRSGHTIPRSTLLHEPQ